MSHFYPIIFFISDAIASEESVRITPSLRSQKGAIWSKLARWGEKFVLNLDALQKNQPGLFGYEEAFQ